MVSFPKLGIRIYGTYRNECLRCIQNREFKNSLVADSSQTERSEKGLLAKCLETSKYEKLEF